MTAIARQISWLTPRRTRMLQILAALLLLTCSTVYLCGIVSNCLYGSVWLVFGRLCNFVNTYPYTPFNLEIQVDILPGMMRRAVS